MIYKSIILSEILNKIPAIAHVYSVIGDFNLYDFDMLKPHFLGKYALIY